MSTDTFDIYQGDTGPIIRPRPTSLDATTTLDSNWECYIAANYEDATSAVARREVTDKTSDSLRFVAALTPAETATITATGTKPTKCTLVVEVLNTTTTPPFNVEKHYELNVYVQGTSPP